MAVFRRGRLRGENNRKPCDVRANGRISPLRQRYALSASALLAAVLIGAPAQAAEPAPVVAPVVAPFPAPVLAAPGAETLAQAVAAAYENNPDIRVARTQVRQLDEAYVQARTGWRPTADLTGNVTRQDAQDVPGFPANESSFALSLTQPLYTGGRVRAAVAAAREDVAAGRATLRATEQDVIQAVVTAFIDVRRDTQGLEISRGHLEILRRQLDQTQSAFTAGDLTRSDVAQAQSRFSNAQASLAQAVAQLEASRAEYVAVVGHPPGTLAPEPSLDSQLPGSIEAAFDAAEAMNPLLVAAIARTRASQDRVAQARAQHLPVVSLQANAGYSATNTFGVGPFSNLTRGSSLTAVFTLPLYSGGLVSSQVRQAVNADTLTRIGVEQQRRSTVQSVSQIWSSLLAARTAITAEEAQVSAAREAAEGLGQEERAGQRETIEVLNAQEEFESAQLQLIAARRNAYLAATAILAQTGGLDVGVLSPGVKAYDPDPAFQKTVHHDFGVPWEPLIAGLDSIGAPSSTARPAPKP